MLFHSLAYAALLLATIGCCWVTTARWRWIPLLVASLGFYLAWRPEYVLLLLTTTASCHFGALAIERVVDRNKRVILAGVIGFNLLILFLFKYYGLFAQSANQVLGMQLAVDLGFLLPVGISFYTFQAIGYVVDVYWGKVAAERSWLRTTLFVSFFPQLVAGPIERANRLLPALKKNIYFRRRNIHCGCWLILWGLFKKVVIADRLALLVDSAYEQPDQATANLLAIATYAFAFQIYCDFSGYTDMAIGSAKIFGIDLMQNFRVPYLASSLREFWGRWHISLSTWFRDYLYIPLGGNRANWWRWTINILIVFCVSGLWHGAKWTYVVWGLIHGSAILVEQLLLWVIGRRRSKANLSRTSPMHLVGRCFKVVLTFHIVLIAWVFFRAASMGDAILVLSRFAELDILVNGSWPLEFSRFELAISILALAWMCLLEFPTKGNIRLVLGYKPRWLRHGLVVTTLLLVVNFGIFSNPTQFVYFQF
ncbi:MAG: MBOAT family protein [Planctomycetales bacterium]|nr:MBOAT family protein [Planctomycetales bacterium]